MADTIKIYNPKDIPFGQLSNNYRHQMKIDNRDWFYATSYIYANLLRNTTNVEKVREANVKNIQSLYRSLDNEEFKATILKGINEALKVKFENEDLKQLLLETKHYRIVYASNDEFLGIGIANKGENYYGKMLMQARHNIIIDNQIEEGKKIKEEKQQKLIDIYLASTELTAAILDGNNLEEYLNLTPTEIVDKLGREKLLRKLPSNIDLDLPYLTRFLDNPTNLVLQIRKDYISRYRLIKIKQRNSIVFDMYADYLLELYYTDLKPDQYREAKRQQFADKNLENLQERLYNLYIQGSLNKNLTRNIDSKLADFVVPNEELVKQIIIEPIIYKNQEIGVYKKKTIDVDIRKIIYTEVSNPSIIVYPEIFDGMDANLVQYVKFAPDTFVEPLYINNLVYPNVSLYFYNLLLSRLDNVGSLEEGYKLLSLSLNENISLNNFVTPINAKNIYDKLYIENYVNKIRKNTEIALNEKFKDRELQDILLITGDADLIWDDFTDSILGSGSKEIRGQNYVGLYLMELRQKIVEERQNETIDILSTEQITNFLNKDTFMKRWLEMRVEDMCKINIIMKNYLWKKEQTNTQLASSIVTQVIDRIYQPCSHIYVATNKVTAEVPPYFEKMIKNCNGFNQVPSDTIQIMWKRIVVMIYYLMEHMQTSSIQNIRSVLAQLELMVSESATCEPIIPKDEFENCIASALLNILVGIKEFYNKLSNGAMVEITRLEIDTAISIIIGTDINKKENKQQTINPQQTKIQQITQLFAIDEEDEDEDEDIDEELRRELENQYTIRKQLPPSRRTTQPLNTIQSTQSALYKGNQQDGDENEQEYQPDEDGDENEQEYQQDFVDSLYQDFDIPEDDDELTYNENEYSPSTNNLKQKLTTLGLVSNQNIDDITQLIESAIQTIKLRKMSKKVKQNRINFFATQR